MPKTKIWRKAGLCYMNTDGFIAYIKTEDIYKHIFKNTETRFDTTNYKLEKPLPKRKNKKEIRLMKDKLGGKVMARFAAFRPKTCSYLTDDGDENKKAKGTKRVS